MPDGPRKLYVARTDTQRRQMRNEPALIGEMRRRGYEIVVPASLSFTEQVRLFRSASIVVGAHGAGLTNIIFCEPGTVVYELVPAAYPNAYFCNLALVCRLRYWADAFDSPGDMDQPPNLRDWESNTAQVAARVTEIDAVMASMAAEAVRQTISAMDLLRGDRAYSTATQRPNRRHRHSQGSCGASSWPYPAAAPEVDRVTQPELAQHIRLGKSHPLV
ncbi:MAG: glycosyltransferase family 61 protein [Rhodopila sp.]